MGRCPRERRAEEEDHRDADSVLDPDHPARRGCVCLVGWISQCGGAECGRALRSAVVAPSVAPSEAPSVAPSESAAAADPFAVFRDETVKPTVEQVTTALPEFAEAFTAAAAADATDTDKIAFGTAAFKLRVALEFGCCDPGRAGRGSSGVRGRGADAAQGFFTTLTEDSQDLLAETTANPDQADAVTEFVEKATTSATELTTALDQACA